MAASYVRIGECEYLNVSQVQRVKFLRSSNEYEIILTNKEKLRVDRYEHSTTFDITDEKEISNETV